MLESQAAPLKELTNKRTWTHLDLQHRGSRLKGIREIWGGNELCDIRARGGGQLSPRQKMLVKAIAPF